MKPNVNVRNDESLAISATRLQSDMKKVHARYSDLVSDLAIYTKSELKPIKVSIDENNLNGTLKAGADRIFEKIENVLVEMDEAYSEMEEIIQVIGGMEFYINNTVDKLSQIIRDQESQQARMAKELSLLQDEFNADELDADGLKESLEDFQIEFSRLQDYVIASVPRLNKVFDELQQEEKAGTKYGKNL